MMFLTATASKAFITRLALSVFAFLFLIAPPQTAYAAPYEPGAPHLSLSGFLIDMSLTFNEYLAIAAQFEDEGTFPHRLDMNSERYERYMRSNPGIAESTAYANVNINADYTAYFGILDVPDPNDTGLLVNSHFQLPADWIPDDLTDVPYGRSLRAEAAEAYIKMKSAVEDAGMYLHLVSAYRTFDRQENLHRNAVFNYGPDVADKEVARAGHSEHQTGLAVDILDRLHSGRLEYANFQDTEVFFWLTENARNYGFILRYPEEYAQNHGYLYEPWHWRYVGTDIAAAMHELDTPVFEEFYGKYLASGVLHNVRKLVLEQQAAEAERIEAENRERIEAEAAALAAIKAEQAVQEAELAAKQAALAADAEAADKLRRELSAHLASLNEQESAARDARDNKTVIIITLSLLAAALCVYVILYKKAGKRNDSNHRLQSRKLAKRASRGAPPRGGRRTDKPGG